MAFTTASWMWISPLSHSGTTNISNCSMKGGRSKVIILKVAADTEDLALSLKKLASLKWNYLTVPGLTDDEKTVLSAWIKQAREKDHKTFKAVLPNCAADHEGIINFTTDEINSSLSETPFTATEYCARIAGVLAGLSLARSSTYYVLSDVIFRQYTGRPQ